jgi:hypothetical protein
MIALLTLLIIVFAQAEGDSERAAALIRSAIEARGGDQYLAIRTVVAKGYYTRFTKGVPEIPEPFTDYIAYPDRERTEFGRGGRKFIQTNAGNFGWIYDAQQKMIRDQTDQQVRSWQQGMRYDLDNLLRIHWKEPGAKIVYLGRREAWHDVFSEAIRIDFADDSWVTIHFDRRTGLPLMIEYKRITEDGPVDEQVRYFQWVELGGIKFSNIQDVYRNGQQVARINYTSISYNVNLPEALFAKPKSPKEVK